MSANLEYAVVNFALKSSRTVWVIAGFAALILALLGVFIAQKVGTSGGEIRHTEIRANAVPVSGAEQNAAAGEKEESEDKD